MTDDQKIAYIHTRLNWSTSPEQPFKCIRCERRTELAVWPAPGDVYNGESSAHCLDCGYQMSLAATELRPEHKCCVHDHWSGLGLQHDCRDLKGKSLQ